MVCNALFALMAMCQSVSLLWIGIDSGTWLTPVLGWLADDLPWRLGLDLSTAAAAVHAFALYPRRLAARHGIAAGAWALAGLATAAMSVPDLPYAWWWGQGAILALGAGRHHGADALLCTGAEPLRDPDAPLRLRGAGHDAGRQCRARGRRLAAGHRRQRGRLGGAGVVAVLRLADGPGALPVARTAPAARIRDAGRPVSTVATSLDLLFVTLFSLEPFASLTLAVFIALAGYAAARQWMLNQMLGSRVLTTERTFEQLYRVARELQKAPERRGVLMAQLLRDLFDPLEVLHVPRAAPRARVLADGSALVVPVRGRRRRRADVPGAALRAPRPSASSRRDDARLTDRVVDQLRRAVAYDRAVERGRTEERLRIAQDLHDDIGARLLTLMYKAQDPEIEDYLRHTLQDLKTLTRGLAASDHRLSHVGGRMEVRHPAAPDGRPHRARLVLRLRRRPRSSAVVQWSALTRVLRELVSNAIYHARATRLEIDASLAAGVLRLNVTDDGIGRDPKSWSHGLGLGGVRKRVKQLGGDVVWRENGAQRHRLRGPGTGAVQTRLSAANRTGGRAISAARRSWPAVPRASHRAPARPPSTRAASRRARRGR